MLCVVAIVIVVVFVLCYPIISHPMMILYCHASMLTPHISLTTCALWLAQNAILECSSHANYWITTILAALSVRCVVW